MQGHTAGKNFDLSTGQLSRRGLASVGTELVA